MASTYQKPQYVVPQPVVGTRCSAILNYLSYIANLSANCLWQNADGLLYPPQDLPRYFFLILTNFANLLAIKWLCQLLGMSLAKADSYVGALCFPSQTCMSLGRQNLYNLSISLRYAYSGNGPGDLVLFLLQVYGLDNCILR